MRWHDEDIPAWFDGELSTERACEVRQISSNPSKVNGCIPHFHGECNLVSTFSTTLLRSCFCGLLIKKLKRYQAQYNNSYAYILHNSQMIIHKNNAEKHSENRFKLHKHTKLV